MRKFGTRVWENAVARLQQNQVIVAALLLGTCSCSAATDTSAADEGQIQSKSEGLLTAVNDATLLGCPGKTSVYIYTTYLGTFRRVGDDQVFTGDACGSVSDGGMVCYSQERFVVQRIRDTNGNYNGYIALIDSARGQYVSATNGGGSSIYANRNALGIWEEFLPVTLKDLRQNPQPNTRIFAFETINGSYVTAEQGGGSVMNANRSVVGPWETFGVACGPT
jgi:hypothetical protein